MIKIIILETHINMNSTRENLEISIDNINSVRFVKPSGNLNEKVKHVAVVLCGSRKDSTLKF
jgi:hypothetical protein